jgi:ABC-type transport system involved in cytochrome c biogenesis ATPase subunit
MIEFDYTLERDYAISGDNKTEKRVFRPSGIPTQLDNLVYIEGPNACGKSTLLNIIALGLHGLKKESLNPALRKPNE